MKVQCLNCINSAVQCLWKHVPLIHLVASFLFSQGTTSVVCSFVFLRGLSLRPQPLFFSLELILDHLVNRQVGLEFTIVMTFH